MATKNNPGAFDCYENAEPDEPIFVLLGRDQHAPALIWLWCTLRELDGERDEKLQEARECAVAMIGWNADRGKPSVGLGHAALAAVMELIRGCNAHAKECRNAPTTVEQARAFFRLSKFEGADEATKTASP